MQLTYVIPGPMHATRLGTQEVCRRSDALRRWAAPDTSTQVSVVDRGPASIESMYEEYLTVAPLAERVLAAEAEESDATIIGCFGDPGLDGIREVASRPVVGPASAAMALATTLGHRFGIITVADSVRHPLRRLAWENGLLEALACVRVINVPVLDLTSEPGPAVTALRAECDRAVREDGADTLVLGCMSMGFLDIADTLTAEVGVPVVNPVQAALHHAETLVRMCLVPSRRAYPTPPKVVSGQNLGDLLLTSDAPYEVTS